MLVYTTDELFAWARLEDHPHLSTLCHLLQALPDRPLLDGLKAARGQGRDDYPIEPLWGVVVLTIALRHNSTESCLAELHRNPSLYRLLGIPSQERIPNDYNVSRFLDTLGKEPHLSQLRKVFDSLVGLLGQAVPDLGENTAADTAALAGRPKRKAEAVAQEVAQGLPQPSGGTKEYKDD